MIESYFLDSDRLASFLNGYHPRATQIQAATYISEAIEDFKNLVIEAPTGSGKTMAYLIPAYHHGRRTIISTKTKQLMQQLYLKDIPVMQQLFGERSVAMLKGRKNYFCPHRFMRWIYPNKIYYQDVVEWFNSQEDAIIEVPRGIFDPPVIDKMTADSNQCIHVKCKYYTSCPFTKAKELANEASIVITNHHLLLADIAMKANESYGSVFEHSDHIIFDEAHSIADIYAVFAGAEISTRRLVNMISDFKEKVSVENMHKLNVMQSALYNEVNDGKKLYKEISERIHPFIELCGEMVDIIDDSDLKIEFAHIENTYKILNMEDDGLRTAEQRGRDLLLKYIPMQVGNDFIEGMYAAALSSIFISATLTTNNNSFDYFLRETGLEHENVTTVTLPHVFKMKQQAMFLVSKNSTDVDNKILNVINRVNGSILLICNSIGRMIQISKFLSENQSVKAIFTQDDGDWSTFTVMENIVLVGCASLREGLDLAGGDFSCVIIDKLPFEYPNDLYLARKAKLVEEEFGNSFEYFYLPRAVLYFKQAAGRLIRHESNKGILVCMDNRILTRSYGNNFLNVLDNITVTHSLEDAVGFVNNVEIIE